MLVSAELSVVSAIAGSGGAVEQVAVGELGRQVLGVGGAAAVAEEEQRLAPAQRRRRSASMTARQRVGVALDELPLRLGAGGEDAPDLVLQHGAGIAERGSPRQAGAENTNGAVGSPAAPFDVNIGVSRLTGA